MNPLVSVVIPTYNHANFLGRAVQSLLDQTYPHWEALIVDNHSQDTTDEVIGRFRDSRIRALKIHNQGVIAASRNLGMREATGEWIAFLDSDDYWYSTKLETVMALVKHEDAYDVVCNDELMVYTKTGAKRISRCGPYEKDFYKALLVKGNLLSPSSTVVRRDFLVRHSLAFDELETYITVEDYAFWLDLARAGARFKFIREVHGEYLVHGANNSTRLATHWQNSENLLRWHVFDVQRFHASPEKLWKRVSARLHIDQARHFAANGQKMAALALALRTVVDYPADTAMSVISKVAGKLAKIRA